jgi:hypothetical protein
MTDGKIPVRATVFGGFGLVLTNFPAVVKISWLPLLLSSVVAAWPLTRFPNRDLSGLDSTELSKVLATYNNFTSLGSIVTMLLMTMLLVGLVRFFLREDVPRLPFYLHWGMDEWRVLGASIVGYVIVLGVLFAFGFVAILVTTVLYFIFAALGIAPPLEVLGSLNPAGNSGLSAFLAIASIWLLFLAGILIALALWISARIWFFYAGPVAEEKLDISRFLKLTQGHAGRIAGIMVLWSLLSYLAVGILGLLIDLLITKGAILEYFKLLTWTPGLSALSIDPWSEMPRLMIGATLGNILMRLPILVGAPIYVLTYLYRIKLEEADD